MFRLVLVAAASVLMLAQAPARESREASPPTQEPAWMAWASSKAAPVPSDTVIVGENCYIERELALDHARRTYLRTELICD